MYAFTFVKVAERHLISDVQTNGTVDVLFEGWLRACEGNPSLIQQAHTQDLAISSMSPNGKARVKQIPSEADPGNAWKFDDPMWVPGEAPPIPVKNPDGAIQAMKDAIDALLDAAPTGPARLHILNNLRPQIPALNLL
jgi:hypothetical protein